MRCVIRHARTPKFQSAIIKKMAACRSEKHYFPNLGGCKNIKKILNEPYKFNQICLLSHENFCQFSNVFCQNYGLFLLAKSKCRYLSNSVVFVFVYDNRAENEHEDSQSLLS